MFMTFGMFPPFLSYGVIDAASGSLVHHVPIESVPGPRYQHDIAITERFTILMDLPMYADPELLKAGKHRVRFFRDRPARFGLVPRHGRGDEVRWFEAEPCYVYHTINAWEEGDESFVRCRIADPHGRPDEPDEVVRRALDRPSAARALSPRVANASRDRRRPRAAPRRYPRRVSADGQPPPRRSIAVQLQPEGRPVALVVFEGLVKHDFERESDVIHAYRRGWSAGEAVVCPREGSTGEDDAYVLTFALEHATGKSELWVSSAGDFGAPIARLAIPARVPVGYHAWWVPAAAYDREVSLRP